MERIIGKKLERKAQRERETKNYRLKKEYNDKGSDNETHNEDRELRTVRGVL